MENIAIIDNGEFSGNHPYVYRITDKIDSRILDLINDGYCFAVYLTKEEFEYISSLPEDLDILYLADEDQRFSPYYY